MAILMDASVFCAYANLKDVHHSHSKQIIEDVVSGKYGDAVITDYIFDEIVTVVARKVHKEKAIQIGKFLLSSEVILTRVNTLVFEKAWEVFNGTANLSFTDCTCVAFMQLFEVKKIATFDKEFGKIGGVEIVD